jgi:hypothetical protein
MAALLTLRHNEMAKDAETLNELWSETYNHHGLLPPGQFRPQPVVNLDDYIPTWSVIARRDFRVGDVVALYPMDILMHNAGAGSLAGYSAVTTESFQLGLSRSTNSAKDDFNPKVKRYSTLVSNGFQAYRTSKVMTNVVPNIRDLLEKNDNPLRYINFIPMTGDEIQLDAFGSFIRDGTYDVTMLDATLDNIRIAAEEESIDISKTSRRGANRLFANVSSDEEEEEEISKKPRVDKKSGGVVIDHGNCCVYLGHLTQIVNEKGIAEDGIALGALFAHVEGGLQRVLSIDEFNLNRSMARAHYLLVVAKQDIEIGEELTRGHGEDHWSGRYKIDFGQSVTPAMMHAFMQTNDMLPGICSRRAFINDEDVREDVSVHSNSSDEQWANEMKAKKVSRRWLQQRGLKNENVEDWDFDESELIDEMRQLMKEIGTILDTGGDRSEIPGKLDTLRYLHGQYEALKQESEEESEEEDELKFLAGFNLFHI